MQRGQNRGVTRPPWGQSQPNHIPIPPINRSNKKRIPHKMAWALTIHKSQWLTLTRSSIDIGNTEHQGLTFTVTMSLQHYKECELHHLSPLYAMQRWNTFSCLTLLKREEAHLDSLLSLSHFKLHASIPSLQLPYENTNIDCQYN